MVHNIYYNQWIHIADAWNVYCITSEEFFKPQLCKRCHIGSPRQPHKSLVTFKKKGKVMICVEVRATRSFDLIRYFLGEVWCAFWGVQLHGEICQKGLQVCKNRVTGTVFPPIWPKMSKVEWIHGRTSEHVHQGPVGQIHGSSWFLPIQLQTESWAKFLCLKETESPAYIIRVLLSQPQTLQQEGQMRQMYSYL